MSVYHSPTNRGIWSLQKVDQYLFLAEASFSGPRAGALRILDVSTPSLPIEIGSYEIGNLVLDLAIDGTLAHITAEITGYYIIDISNLATPTVVSNIPIGGYSVTVSGKYSYLITYNGAVHALDISNPMAPTPLSVISFGAGWHIRSQGNYLFAACLRFGLYILDASVPDAPEPIFNFNRGRSILRVYVENNLLSLSDATGSFVLDISDIYHPQSILSHITTTIVRSTFITENNLYVGEEEGEFAIYDMSQATLIANPSVSDVNQYPMILSIYDHERKLFPFQLTVNQIPFRLGNIQDFSVLPDATLSEFIPLSIYFRDEDEGFYWSHLDCDNLNVVWDLQARETHRIDLGCYIYDYHLLQEESLALVACGRNAFRIYDLSNPKKPDLLFQHYRWPRSVLSFDYQDNLVYLYEFYADDHFLVIYDLQDPLDPVQMSSFRLPARHTKIRVFSDLGVGFNDNHYFLYDISNSTSPSTLSSLPFPQAQDAFIKDGSLCISSATEGVYIYDIRDPANPVQMSKWDTPTTTMVYYNHVLHLATLDQGAAFLDVRNTSSPVMLSQLNITEFDVKRLALRRNILTLASQNEVYFYDISNLQAPIQIGQYVHPFEILQMGFSDSALFIGDANNNFNLIDAKSLYQLSFLTKEVAGGNYLCSLEFIDELGGSTFQTLRIRLEGPPQINTPLLAQLAIVGQPFNFFVPQGTFRDPNFDPIDIVARRKNDSLPEWLYFDGVSQLSGLPRSVDLGRETIVFELTDHHPQLPKTYTNLTLVVEDYLPPHSFVSGRHFEYILPSFVFSQIGNMTQLSAQQMDGESLPMWLSFDEQTARFYGNASDNYFGSLFIELKATNAVGDKFRRPVQFDFSTNLPPYVQNQIPNQIANVGDEFLFPLSDTVFSDGNGDELRYSAKEEGKATLPKWLDFDGQLFNGNPERSDMNFFSGKRYNIEVTASDGYRNATLVYNIDVKGTSSGELLLKIGSPILTLLGLGLAAYRNRRYILNKANRAKYQLPAVRIEAGQPCSIPLQTSAEIGNTIQLKFRAPRQGRCCSFFRSNHVSLFDAALPYWLHYDISSNQLISKRVPDKPFRDNTDPIIQVKDKDGIIQEQFSLEVVYPEAQLTLDTHRNDNPDRMPSLPPPPPPADSGVQMSNYNPG